jgi:hypothetical protein
VKVAFWDDVAPVVVEVHLCLCASGLSVDSLLCHFDKEGSILCDFHEPLLGVYLSQPSPDYAQQKQLTTASLLGLWRKGS